MRALIIGLWILSSLTSFAGTLENRSTGEQIELNVNDFTLIVDARRASSTIKTIKLIDLTGELQANLKAQQEDIELYALTARLWEVMDIERDFDASRINAIMIAVVIPFYSLPLALTSAMDTVALPIILPMKLISTGTAKKDLKIVNRAIFTDEKVKVSNLRFNRLKGYFGL